MDDLATRARQHVQARIDWANTLLAATDPALDAGAAAAALDELADAERIALELESSQADLPIHTLIARFGLLPESIRILWIAIALADRGATLDAVTLARTTERAARHQLAPHHALARFALLERADGAAPALHPSRWSWAVAPRIVAFLDGDTLSPRPTRPALDELVIEPSTLDELRAAISVQRGVVLVCGPVGLGRRSALVAASTQRSLELDCRTLPTDLDALAVELRHLCRECRLAEAIPVLANLDVITDEARAVVGRELVPSIAGQILATSTERLALAWDRPVLHVDMRPPTTAQRAQLWHRALGQGSQQDAEFLATRYPLAPALACRAAEATRARAGTRPITEDDVFAAIRGVLDDKLGRLARRVATVQTWQDIVLSREQRTGVLEIIARIGQRRRVYEEWGFGNKVAKGIGVSALFSGPPGTGKTMIASLIARELGLELYQVDVARIVSKYIGETEKQLAALFDGAEAGHAILLFDEADSLFGKRTDVKSSNDRYANLETNYLLERLERFTGVCLLTTNHESNLDPALRRRLSIHLRFELPDEEARTALWRAMLPADAPVDDKLDLGELARRFKMSGGYIRNAVVRAAFMAAHEDAPIERRHLEYAARVEYEGMGNLSL